MMGLDAEDKCESREACQHFSTGLHRKNVSLGGNLLLVNFWRIVQKDCDAPQMVDGLIFRFVQPASPKTLVNHSE